MRIFADKHFLDVRTNNGLSYPPEAWFTGSTTSSARFAVSTTEPDKYIAVFDKLKQQGFMADEVKNMKVTYLTGSYFNQETNSAQAPSLAANEVLHNNWKRSLTLVDDVKKLSADDINNGFRKYMATSVGFTRVIPKK